MSRTVRLDTLRDDVRFRGDFGGATVRHTNAQLTRLINQSIQMFRERISDEGSTHYLVPYSGTLGVGPTSPYAFYQLDLSSGPSPALVRTYGIDVTIDGQVYTLAHVPFEARNDYGTASGGARPAAWAHFRTDQVAILPAPNGAYPFTVWYLPKYTDLSADSDAFDGVAGWEEWVVWDVVCQVIARDQFPQAYAIAEQRRAEVEQRVIRGATKVSQAGGAHVGRDSFGERLGLLGVGRRGMPATSGGPYVPASGSVTNAMLADMTGPTVKGVMSGTTRPQDVQVATLTTYLGLFNTTQRGLVPPPLAQSSLFLRDDGTWASAGAGAGGSVGPSGAIQYQAGTGMAGASGFRVHGNSPSLVISLDGSMRVTGGQVEVGSGTVRVSASGINVGGGSVINVGTLVASAIAAPSVTSTTAGLAPASGGGTTNFLRADGTWDAPPGGAGSAPGGNIGDFQFNNGVGGFGGASGVKVVASGTALGFGGAADGAMPNTGHVRVGSGALNFALVALGASGANQNLILYGPQTAAGGTTLGATGGVLTLGRNTGSIPGALEILRSQVATGGHFYWQIGASGAATARLLPTGLDIGNFHLHARSVTVFSGIPNTELSPMASGTIKGQLGADAIPRDIPLQSMTAALYHFDTVTRGVVPVSPGGTTDFLRADGAWGVPPGGSATQPSGIASSVQFRGAAGFEGATGITVVASGQAFAFGPAPASAGTLRLTNELGVIAWARAGGGDTIGPYLDASNNLLQGAPNGGYLAPENQALYTATGGTAFFRIGAREYALGHNGAVFPNTLTLGSGLTNANLLPMGSGTVKGNLGATGAPQDVPVATLFAAIPTFTSTQRGVVPPSDGLATSYLAGNGSWTAPSGAAQFPPSGGVQNYQLAPVASGTVKGNLGPSGPVTDIAIPTLSAFVPTFTATQRGLVPQSGGGTTNYLRADGTWNSPPGGSASPGGSIGNIQYNNGAGGFAGASGLNAVASGTALGISATFASLGDIRGGQSLTTYALSWSGSDVRLTDWGGQTGTFRLGDEGVYMPRMRSDVGTGGRFEFAINGADATGTTARILPTGVDFRGFHLAARSISLATGLANEELQPIGSGMIHGRLSGTGAMQNVPFATFMAFAPTFTSVRMGVVPASGGGTTNFLRADGTWGAPPGGSASPGGAIGNIQYHDGVGFGGATGISIVASGQALAFGVPSFHPGFGDVRVASGFNITANLPSGIAGVAARQNLLDWSGGGASGVLKVGGASGILGTHRSEVATGGAFEWLIGGQTGMTLKPTGLDASQFHITAKSLDVLHINGLPTDANALKRGINIGAAGGTGVPSGLNLYVPGAVSSGANRYIIPSGFSTATNNIILNPTGAKGGATIRVERLDPAGTLNFVTPTGTILYAMPSGRKHVADFVFTKPSGTAFEHGGWGDLF